MQNVVNQRVGFSAVFGLTGEDVWGDGGTRKKVKGKRDKPLG
jgi:hypothetical protein